MAISRTEQVSAPPSLLPAHSWFAVLKSVAPQERTHRAPSTTGSCTACDEGRKERWNGSQGGAFVNRARGIEIRASRRRTAGERGGRGARKLAHIEGVWQGDGGRRRCQARLRRRRPEPCATSPQRNEAESTPNCLRAAGTGLRAGSVLLVCFSVCPSPIASAPPPTRVERPLRSRYAGVARDRVSDCSIAMSFASVVAASQREEGNKNEDLHNKPTQPPLRLERGCGRSWSDSDGITTHYTSPIAQLKRSWALKRATTSVSPTTGAPGTGGEVS